MMDQTLFIPFFAFGVFVIVAVAKSIREHKQRVQSIDEKAADLELQIYALQSHLTKYEKDEALK